MSTKSPDHIPNFRLNNLVDVRRLLKETLQAIGDRQRHGQSRAEDLRVLPALTKQFTETYKATKLDKRLEELEKKLGVPVS